MQASAGEGDFTAAVRGDFRVTTPDCASKRQIILKGPTYLHASAAILPQHE